MAMNGSPPPGRRAAVIAGLRTPFVKAGSDFRNLGAVDLGALVVNELVARTGLPASTYDSLVFGQVVPSKTVTLIGREMVLRSQLPRSTEAHTVARACATSIQAATTAADQIALGHATAVVAGGAESISDAPIFASRRLAQKLVELSKARTMAQRLSIITSLRPRDFTPHVLKNLEDLGIGILVAIGGDDTLSYGERLHREGVEVIAIPKTMDNDVFGTDYCIGFSTAVTRSVQFIHQLRTSSGSHERIAVVELFGRNSGETSLISSYLAGVDRALISEVPFDPERLAKLVMQDKRTNPSNYAMVTISEGAHMLGGKVIEYGEADAYGHRKLGGIGLIVGEALKKLTGEDIVYQQIAYLMRSGAPDAVDLMVSVNYAHMAMDLILEGVSGRMCALREGTYTHVPVSTITSGLKRVDVDELYDTQEYLPKVRKVLGKPMFLY